MTGPGEARWGGGLRPAEADLDAVVAASVERLRVRLQEVAAAFRADPVAPDIAKCFRAARPRPEGPSS